MNLDVIEWFKMYEVPVLQEVVKFVHKECEINENIDLNTKNELANYILDTVKQKSKIENPTDAFIWLLGLYHFKSTPSPFWKKIYYNDSVFGKFF